MKTLWFFSAQNEQKRYEKWTVYKKCINSSFFYIDFRAIIVSTYKKTEIILISQRGDYMSIILSDCIKYEQTIENLIMILHPIDRVFSNTRLEVAEGQEAVTYESGTLRGPYGEGERRLLESVDGDAFVLDIVSRLRRQRPFKCRTYFVAGNRNYTFNWGVGNLVFNVHNPSVAPYRFGMSGTITINITDSVKFVGAFLNNNYVTVQMLDMLITEFVSENIKANISEIIRNNHMDIYYIEDYMNKMSDLLMKYIAEATEIAGMSIRSFSVEHIKRTGEWVRPPMDQVSEGAVNRFQKLSPDEKELFFKQFSQLVTTDEDRELLVNVINSTEGR